MTRPVTFGDWVWEPDTLELCHGARRTNLEPRVARLFEYFIAHQGELLTRDQLVEAVWDGRVVSDEAVRRAVFNLRQALQADDSTGYIRTIHKKGYIARFPAVQAPAPEMPAGHADAQPEDAVSGESAPAITAPPDTLVQGSGVSPGRLRALAIIAVALVAGAALLYVLMTLQRAPPDQRSAAANAEPASLAILPLVNRSEAASGGYLADGLTDELFATLERNRDLRVTARSSAFQVESQKADSAVDSATDSAAIAQRLGVRYLLDGHVSGGEAGLQVQLRLLDTDKGVVVWADRYESATPDWFELQQGITESVARAVQSRLHQDARALEAMPRRASSAEAQLEVLRARQLLVTRSVADAEQAIEHLQRALTLDPDYALAYARLADAILIQAESTTGTSAARPVVAPLLEKALALDPGLGEAYALRSQLAADTAAAERDVRRGLELNPSYARGYELLAALQSRQPLQLPQAVATIDNAIALDPLTPGNYHTKALLKMGQGEWEEAAALDRRALELNPNYRAALAQLSMTYGVQGDFADAVGYARRAVALDPRAVPLREHLILVYLAVGDLDAARAADNPPTALGSVAIPWAEGKVREVAESFYGGVHVSDTHAPFTASIASHILLRQAVSDGDYDRAVALLSPLLLEDGRLRPQASGWGLYAYVNLAQLLRLSGDIPAALRLEEELEQQMEAMADAIPRHRFINEQLRSILLASAGRSDEACAALNYSYTPKPRLYWKMILDNPAFDGMVDTPCLQALRASIDRYIAAERERIDAMKREDDAATPDPPSQDYSAGAAT